MMLHRTLGNLMQLTAYNESILTGLNDMGDALLIVDTDGRIYDLNDATGTLLGYDRAELIGDSIRTIVGEDGHLFDPFTLRALAEGGSIINREVTFATREGDEIPILLSGSVVVSDDGERRIVAIGRNIADVKRAEEVRKNMLLIQEIHHRIKNNLQVISSLLYLQSGYVADPKTKAMFQESRDRVRSMALIHEKLYQSPDLAGLIFRDYLSDLIDSLVQTYGKTLATPAELDLQVDDMSLDMDMAIPCGLIVNELVSNALKHAFGDGRHPRLIVRASLTEVPHEVDGPRELLVLEVSDNGIGLPDDLDIETSRSLGLKLVRTLTDQLHGSLELSTDGGTRFLITVPLEHPGAVGAGADRPVVSGRSG